MIQVFVYDIDVLYAHVLMIPFFLGDTMNTTILHFICYAFDFRFSYDSRKCLVYHWGEFFGRYILTY